MSVILKDTLDLTKENNILSSPGLINEDHSSIDTRTPSQTTISWNQLCGRDHSAAFQAETVDLSSAASTGRVISETALGDIQ